MPQETGLQIATSRPTQSPPCLETAEATCTGSTTTGGTPKSRRDPTNGWKRIDKRLVSDGEHVNHICIMNTDTLRGKMKWTEENTHLRGIFEATLLQQTRVLGDPRDYCSCRHSWQLAVH